MDNATSDAYGVALLRRKLGVPSNSHRLTTEWANKPNVSFIDGSGSLVRVLNYRATGFVESGKPNGTVAVGETFKPSD